MNYLILGIWHGRQRAETQSHRTDTWPDVEQAMYAVVRHADRTDVPDEVLLIEDESGPKVTYNWAKDMDYTQQDFDNMRASLSANPPEVPR